MTKKYLAALTEDVEVLSSQVNTIMPLATLNLEENDETTPQSQSSMALLVKLNASILANTKSLKDFRTDNQCQS